MRHYLCDKIRAERHLDYLRSRRILNRDDAEEIGCRTTQTKRTAMLLDMLAENPRGLDALIDSIREQRSQNFIIAKITDEVQKAKNEKMESLQGERAETANESCFSSAVLERSNSTFHCSLLQGLPAPRPSAWSAVRSLPATAPPCSPTTPPCSSTQTESGAPPLRT